MIKLTHGFDGQLSTNIWSNSWPHRVKNIHLDTSVDSLLFNKKEKKTEESKTAVIRVRTEHLTEAVKPWPWEERLMESGLRRLRTVAAIPFTSGQTVCQANTIHFVVMMHFCCSCTQALKRFNKRSCLTTEKRERKKSSILGRDLIILRLHQRSQIVGAVFTLQSDWQSWERWDHSGKDCRDATLTASGSYCHSPYTNHLWSS